MACTDLLYMSFGIVSAYEIKKKLAFMKLNKVDNCVVLCYLKNVNNNSVS